MAIDSFAHTRFRRILQDKADLAAFRHSRAARGFESVLDDLASGAPLFLSLCCLIRYPRPTYARRAFLLPSERVAEAVAQLRSGKPDITHGQALQDVLQSSSPPIRQYARDIIDFGRLRSCQPRPEWQSSDRDGNAHPVINDHID